MIQTLDESKHILFVKITIFRKFMQKLFIFLCFSTNKGYKFKTFRFPIISILYDEITSYDNH